MHPKSHPFIFFYFLKSIQFQRSILEKKRKRERRYSRLEELQVRHSFELSNILIRFIFTYSNNYIIDTKEVPTVYLESLNFELII